MCIGPGLGVGVGMGVCVGVGMGMVCHGTLGCWGYLGKRGGEEVRDGPSSEAVDDREDPPAREIESKGNWKI